MALKRLRAVVSDEPFGLTARIPAELSEFQSDIVAEGYRISEVMRAQGRRCHLEREGNDVLVHVTLADDSPESDRTIVADELLEAVS